MHKCAKTVRRKRSGKMPKKNSSYRGLETFDDASEAQFRRIVASCIDAVMDEQDRQWDEGDDVFDWDAFAEVSMACSEASVAAALANGRSDAREAKKAYRQMARDPLGESFHSMSSNSIEAIQDLSTLRCHKLVQRNSTTGAVQRSSRLEVHTTAWTQDRNL